MKRNILYVLTGLILLGCSNDTENPVLPKYKDTALTAQIILIENNDGLIGGIYKQGFNTYHKETLQVFSEIFGVPVAEMENMTLNDIIEKYGEEWQINSIKEAGKAYYDTIVAFRNNECTENSFKTTLKNLSEKGYVIDLVFCLHGSKTSFSLYDKSCYVKEFCDFLNSNGIAVRSLYQTCCYGSYVIDDWHNYGIHAVNGSADVNSITMFSPSYFVEEWVKGNSFEKAVSLAYEREIEKIKEYDKYIPVINYILSPKNLAESSQSIGGINPAIKWKEFPDTM